MHNEQIKDAYEIACLMESRRLCNDLLSALLRFRTTSSHNFIGKDLYDKSTAAKEAVEDLVNELSISICNFEDGLQ
jgi:hypothetical protein